MVWPPANIWNQGKRWQSLKQCTEHMILKRMTQKPPGQTDSGSSRQKSKRMASIGMPHRSHQNIQRVAVQDKNRDFTIIRQRQRQRQALPLPLPLPLPPPPSPPPPPLLLSTIGDDKSSQYASYAVDMCPRLATTRAPSIPQMRHHYHHHHASDAVDICTLWATTRAPSIPQLRLTFVHYWLKYTSLKQIRVGI